MSIKTKMQSLIDAANAKTGKGDTDLTTAVQSLVSESGGITPSGNKAITATTSTLTGIDVTNYATVSVAPTPSEAKSVTTNGDVTPSSGKLLSKVTVNVPTGEARDASDLTVSGATVNVPAGLYSSAASKSVASGTTGTPTASKGAVSNNSVTVTPSVANTTGYITGGTKTGTGVKVSASELVSGNKAITPSETAQSGIDVTNFKTASVGAISSTYVGSGVTRKAAATVAPSTSEQIVCASGVYTTGEQKVSAITPSIVGNLDASSFGASIVAAIEGKGVTVPSGTKLDGMASLIESIEAGGGDFSALPQKIDTVLSGSVTPASDAVYLTIKDFGNSTSMNYLPRIFIVFRKTPASSTSYASCLFALYMSDDPLTEITTGYGGHAFHIGKGANIYAMFGDLNYRLSGNKSALSFGVNGCRVYAKNTQSTFKFQGGVTHYWVALCEKVSA